MSSPKQVRPKARAEALLASKGFNSKLGGLIKNSRKFWLEHCFYSVHDGRRVVLEPLLRGASSKSIMHSDGSPVNVRDDYRPSSRKTSFLNAYVSDASPCAVFAHSHPHEEADSEEPVAPSGSDLGNLYGWDLAGVESGKTASNIQLIVKVQRNTSASLEYLFLRFIRMHKRNVNFGFFDDEKIPSHSDVERKLGLLGIASAHLIKSPTDHKITRAEARQIATRLFPK